MITTQSPAVNTYDCWILIDLQRFDSICDNMVYIVRQFLCDLNRFHRINSTVLKSTDKICVVFVLYFLYQRFQLKWSMKWTNEHAHRHNFTQIMMLFLWCSAHTVNIQSNELHKQTKKEENFKWHSGNWISQLNGLQLGEHFKNVFFFFLEQRCGYSNEFSWIDLIKS